MQSWFKKLVALIILIAIAIGIVIYLKTHKTPEPVVEQPIVETVQQPKVIGTSVEGRKIETYTYGKGPTQLLFVGGTHGGYEWNSVLLAYQFIDYLKANPEVIPENETITIIPSLNPDGVFKVIGKEGRFALSDVPTTTTQAQSVGRFNAHGVDLNRNFDCAWQATSTWQSKAVSAGTSAFSEPEAQALRDFVLETKPSAAVFWHSQSNAVYASHCKGDILPKTLDIMNTYANAAKYPAVKTFTAYVTTGAEDDWLASINIPAITVELQTHTTVEWDRNLAGVKALFDYYTKH